MVLKIQYLLSRLGRTMFFRKNSLSDTRSLYRHLLSKDKTKALLVAFVEFRVKINKYFVVFCIFFIALRSWYGLVSMYEFLIIGGSLNIFKINEFLLDILLCDMLISSQSKILIARLGLVSIL